MTSTLFTNAALKGRDGLVDILVEGGRFKAIGQGAGAGVTPERIVDLGGKLVVPPYCDPHIHLDYVFTALNPAAANKTGSLFEGIQRWSETKGHLSKEEIKAQGVKAKSIQQIELYVQPLEGVCYFVANLDDNRLLEGQVAL